MRLRNAVFFHNYPYLYPMNYGRIITMLEEQLRFSKTQNAQLIEQNARQAELIGRMRREHHVIEFGAADARVRKLLTEELGFLNVLKRQAAVMRRVL